MGTILTFLSLNELQYLTNQNLSMNHSRTVRILYVATVNTLNYLLPPSILMQDFIGTPLRTHGDTKWKWRTTQAASHVFVAAYFCPGGGAIVQK